VASMVIIIHTKEKTTIQQIQNKLENSTFTSFYSV